MLFWMLIIMLVIGLACLFLWDNANVRDWVGDVGAIITVTAVIANIISFIAMGNHIGLDGYVAESHERYDMLVYQYENDIYDNDNDLGKRELIKDIQSWNEDLVWNQANQDDFWIGIYIPDIYDQFELIELG